MRQMRKKALLALLLLGSSAIVFFYYVFVHSGLTEPRITARDVHGFQPPPGAQPDGHVADASWKDESLESVQRQLEQLEHQNGIDRLVKDAKALATAPVPTRRQPRIAHRFGNSELISVAAVVDGGGAEPAPPSSLEAAEEAYARAASESGVLASCQPHRRFGPVDDGGWTVCMAGPYRPVAGTCLVLSFGVGKIWSFDDQVAQRLGCRTLAFDPSLTELANHTRPQSGVQFYRLGLHAKRGRLPGTDWPVDSLQGILESLVPGTDAIVDLLKMDIEGAEWPAVEAALDSGLLQDRVRQLMMEVHSREARPVPNEDSEVRDYAGYLRILDRLRRSGFLMWRSEPNNAGGWFFSRVGHRRRRLCCYNVYYINTRFLPPVNAGQALMEDRLIADMHSVRLHLPLKLPDLPAHRHSPELAEQLYFDLMSAVHADCPDWQRIGPQKDSGYDVCLSQPYSLAVGDKPCIVYSFGVADQYGFEDQLAGGEFGCQVRMFDPSLTQLGEHKRGPQQWLHLVGLAAVDGTRGGTDWTVNSLQTLLRRFGHESATVDLLKIDIESDEWDALEAAAIDGSLARVKQLIVETHTKELQDVRTRPADYLKFVSIWLRLYRLGFRQWRSRENARTHFVSATGRSRPCCHEHSLINIKFM